MADWAGIARSNYFKVKDLQAFKDTLQPTGVEVYERPEKDDDPLNGTVALFGPDRGSWPSYYYDEDKDEDVEVELSVLVGPHLEDEWVCVLQEVGAEKTRYVTGRACAFNNLGEYVSLDLEDIFTMAGRPPRPLGKYISNASY